MWMTAGLLEIQSYEHTIETQTNITIFFFDGHYVLSVLDSCKIWGASPHIINLKELSSECITFLFSSFFFLHFLSNMY